MIGPIEAPPRRIQLRRVKVDRSTEWGNPIRICEPPNKRLLQAYGWRFREPPKVPGSAAEAVAMFEKFIAFDGASIGAGSKALRGKNLACWCPLDQPCHADVWLRIVNAPLVCVGEAAGG
ncbi:DUF4326 domain-containing protein [Rhodopila sp.]|uniref:DUF4326 domain-containing protein n=1 Tax=Rhodopila sp. TaxID=2480087 RepID=UPI003D0E5661